LSSLLPWVRIGERIVRFVPRPTGWALGGDGTDKAYRRVAFVSTEQLTKVAPPYLSRCGTLAHTTTEIEQMTWLARAARPSVTLDRVTSTPHLFHLEELWIATGNENAGASIVVRTADQVGMNLVRTLLGYLADNGMGADRARGLGRFVIAGEEELSLDDAVKPDRTRVLLGCASPDEVLRVALSDPRARYTVTRREGRAHGARGGLGVQRKTLRMLAPGAVIPDRGAVMGRTQDVTPDGFVEHRIYRDGRTLGWVLPERST
jgi:CRISPR-associated protein Csm4